MAIEGDAAVFCAKGKDLLRGIVVDLAAQDGFRRKEVDKFRLGILLQIDRLIESFMGCKAAKPCCCASEAAETEECTEKKQQQQTQQQKDQKNRNGKQSLQRNAQQQKQYTDDDDSNEKFHILYQMQGDYQSASSGR